MIKSLKFKESAAEHLQLAIRLILIKISNQCLKKSKKKKKPFKKGNGLTGQWPSP